jgi:predicted dehydrogenase|tara:strand:- start:659 stop:1648 length:990 start_codon:yes stop_codon:yes gene_type:complete
MSKPRLAIIGSGNIAEFHVLACREAGFNISAIAASPGSKRVRQFSKKHNIPLVYASADLLLDAFEEWDALLICSSIDSTLEILTKAVEIGTPILVEKPISFRSMDLIPLLKYKGPLIVGYNRRFYRTVEKARLFVENNPPLVATLELPESIHTPQNINEDADYLRRFFTNSVHGLDLARYVFGDLVFNNVHRLTNDWGGVISILATLTTDNGSILHFHGNWSTPSNPRLTLDQQGSRFEIKPFETARVYEGMEVLEPTEKIPIRRYLPKQISKITLEEVDQKFKPGFFAQAKALENLINGKSTVPAATIKDAYEVLLLVENLVGKISQH